jgi:hypothetical protein
MGSDSSAELPILPPLREQDMDPDPLAEFLAWYRQAESAGLRLPEAMTLATATPDGQPSARIVLLRGCDAAGFVFGSRSKAKRLPVGKSWSGSWKKCGPVLRGPKCLGRRAGAATELCRKSSSSGRPAKVGYMIACNTAAPRKAAGFWNDWHRDSFRNPLRRRLPRPGRDSATVRW